MFIKTNLTNITKHSIMEYISNNTKPSHLDLNHSNCYASDFVGFCNIANYKSKLVFFQMFAPC